MKNLVAKFGGSSLKDLTALTRCTKIVQSQPETKIVVLSAIKGVTNKLVEISELIHLGKSDQSHTKLKDLQRFHLDFAAPLASIFLNESLNCLFLEANQILRSSHRYQSHLAFTDSLLAIGERASSLIFYFVMERSSSQKISYLDARSIIRTNSDFSSALPDISLIRSEICTLFSSDNNDSLFITQGFIGSNRSKETTTLGRDGSDYSAALFAEAIRAEALQIWTDVPGLASSDPRFVKETKIINEINYQRAELLSQLGANILHPKTLAPAKRLQIPVFVGSSKEPELSGTWIRNNTEGKIPIAGVTQKKNYVRAKVLYEQIPKRKLKQMISEKRSPHISSFYDINSAEFIFNTSVSNSNLLIELQDLGEIEVTQGYENLSIVGDDIHQNPSIMQTLQKIQKSNNLNQFDQGEGHISFLVPESQGKVLMNTFHQQIFANYRRMS